MINWDPQWGTQGDLGTHRGFLYRPDDVVNVKDIKLGRVISFNYQTTGELQSTPRLVFILHPNFEEKCHALTLKNIERDSLINDIYPCLRSGVDNPIDFYHQIYKPTYLYTTNAYRTYIVEKMKNIVQFVYATPVETSSIVADDDFQYDEADKSEIYKMFEKGKGLEDVLKYYKDTVLKNKKDK